MGAGLSGGSFEFASDFDLVGGVAVLVKSPPCARVNWLSEKRGEVSKEIYYLSMT